MTLPTTEQSVFETMLARRSVRSYSSQQVSMNILKTLLEAAVRAPTAMHREPWGFMIIQNRQVLQEFSDRAKPLFMEEIKRSRITLGTNRNLDGSIFYDAGTLLIICARVEGRFSEADCWMAAENMMLAACAMGLGTCVIGSAMHAIDTPEVKSLLEIPADYRPVVPIIVGYPNGETPAATRKAPLIIKTIS